MIRRAILLGLALAAAIAGSPAPAQTVLPPGQIDVSGVLRLGPVTVGRRQSGKFTLTPDAVQIQGTGSTGPVDGMSALGRSLAAHWQDRFNIRDAPYFAKGDGATDDTAAIRLAMAAAGPAGKNLYLPTGTYMATDLAYPGVAYNQMFSLTGDGQNLTIIKRLGAGATKPLLQIGDPLATNFTAQVNIKGIRFNAVDRSAPAVATYDLVRSTMTDVEFMGGSVGYLSYGGISNLFYNANARSNGTGVKMLGFASKAQGGVPNNIRWTGILADNDNYGLDFDDGNNFLCELCDIEGNGHTLGAASGGVRVGPNVGRDIASARPLPGVTLRNSWFEANYGLADVVAQSGLLTIESTKFASAPSQTTNDVLIQGGSVKGVNYYITNSVGAFPKAANLKDDASVLPGNYVIGGYWPSVALSQATIFAAANAFNVSTQANLIGGAFVTNGPLKVGQAYVNASKVATAVSGGNYFVPATTSWVALTQTATIASQGVILPAAVGDGQLIQISTVGAITKLYLGAQGGATVLGWSGDGAPLAANSSASWGYDAASNAWLRLQ